MNHLIEGTDIDASFWDQNPQLKYIKPFSGHYSLDESTNKTFSSRRMWAAFLYCDPTDRNKFYRLPEETKREEIASYVGDPDFTFEEIADVIEQYPFLCMTNAQRAFKGWEDKLMERDIFLRDQTYSLDGYEYDKKGDIVITQSGKPKIIKGSADQLDKLMANTASLWKHYATVKDDMMDEENKSKLRGGRKESKSEQKLI